MRAELIEAVKEVAPGAEAVLPERGEGWAWVGAPEILPACRLLRDRHGFDCLSCLTGTDRGEWFEAVYHLFSYARRESIVLKVKLARSSPRLPSVREVWASADWMEREAYDLLGVLFEGHPNLRRIMLPEDWEGHPLRKDYQEPAAYAGMTTTRP